MTVDKSDFGGKEMFVPQEEGDIDIIPTTFLLAEVKALVPVQVDSFGPFCPGSGCPRLIIQGEELIDKNATDLTFDTRFFRIDLFAAVPGTPSSFNFFNIIENGGERSSAGFAERFDTFLQSSDPSILIPANVPEPSTWVMMLMGFAGLGYLGYRRALRVA